MKRWATDMHVNGFWNLSNLYYIDKPKISYTFKILFFPPFVNRWVSFSATALGDGVKGKQCNIGEALQMVVSGGLNDLSPLIGNMYYFHQNSPTVKCRTYKQSKPITRMPLLTVPSQERVWGVSGSLVNLSAFVPDRVPTNSYV